MRKIWISLFIGIALVVKAQDASVEKSIFGIQAGFLGIWAQNELRLSNLVALRSEIGFDCGVWGGMCFNGNKLINRTFFLATPVLNVEPRFYYNLQKRAVKLKRIDNNSGNFLSLAMFYHPNFIISNYKNAALVSDISVIPTWGMRRNIGERFNYELGGGFGCQFLLNKDVKSRKTGYILLKIGYTL